MEDDYSFPVMAVFQARTLSADPFNPIRHEDITKQGP